MAMHLGRVEDSVFEQVLGERACEVENAVIAHRLVGERSLYLVTERIAALFGASKGDVLRVLGVSRTKVSRRPEMDVEILDRAGSALKVFARVAAIVGEQSAAHWLTKINRHLEGQRPLDLLATHLGRERVEDLVMALEDGVFL
jgi:putative toxin-antitoxin system antitoxin component (TIGR02293 family)